MQPQYAPQPQYAQAPPAPNGYAPAPPNGPPTAANGSAQAFNGMAVPVMVDAPVMRDKDNPKPHIRTLKDRVVALVGTGYVVDKWPADPTKAGDTPKDEVTYILHIFEAGPVFFGEDKTKDTQATHVIHGPAYVLGCTNSNVAILNALKNRINLNPPEAVTGRVGRGNAKQGQSAPYLLNPLAPDDPARHLIGEYWKAYSQGQIPEAVPQELQPTAPVQQAALAQIPQHVQQAMAPIQHAPTGPPPQGAQVHYGPAQQPQYAPAPAAAPVAQPAQDVPPQGFEGMWPTLTPEQKARILGTG